jgi:hypothetical protein
VRTSARHVSKSFRKLNHARVMELGRESSYLEGGKKFSSAQYSYFTERVL